MTAIEQILRTHALGDNLPLSITSIKHFTAQRCIDLNSVEDLGVDQILIGTVPTGNIALLTRDSIYQLRFAFLVDPERDDPITEVYGNFSDAEIVGEAIKAKRIIHVFNRANDAYRPEVELSEIHAFTTREAAEEYLKSL